ncbi:hypothetical protein BH10BAC3_BH10BAC3_04450 [soil metagenome]
MNKYYTLLSCLIFLLITTLTAQVNYSFKATTATYVPVTGGTTPPLLVRPWDFGQTSITYDEGFANGIPLGFTCNYNGVDYTTINICANGFATLGSPFSEDVNKLEKFYINSLKLGPIFNYVGSDTGIEAGTKPVLAPLWDDLNMQADGNLRYITTGAAGNRVFTFEWSGALWQFDAASSVVSFELKLYEGSNIVQFCYKDEGGARTAGASASIGITASTQLGGRFMSLQSTSTSPLVSNTSETNTLNKKPANNQVYSFIPLTCPLTLNAHYTSYDNTSVNFSWVAPNGVTNFEYAVTTTFDDPVTGTATSSTNAVVSSLSPGTKYYIHVRSHCSASSQSAWSSIAFTTTENIVSPPSITCQATLGGSMEDDMNYATNSVKQTSDGGYIVIGTSNSNNGDVTGNHGDHDYWIVKLSSLCIIEWQKSLGGTGFDQAYSIEQTSDGGYIIAGITDSHNGDVSGNHNFEDGLDAWIVKLTSNGDIQWQKCLGGSNLDYAFSIRQTNDGGYILAGKTYSNDGDVSGLHQPTWGFTDYWVVKLNSSGTIEWQKCLGGDLDDEAHSIQQTSDGGYIVAGNSYSNDGDVSGNHGNGDYWIVKLNNTGTIQWQKCLGGTSFDYASSIENTSDGGYIFSGTSKPYDVNLNGGHGKADWEVIKLSSNGTVQWKKYFGGSDFDEAASAKQTSDGGYIIAGNSHSNDDEVSGNHGNADYWIVKLGDTGDLQWQKTFGGSADDVASSIVTTSDGGYLVAGTSLSNDDDVTGNHGINDYWVIKLSPDALLPVTLLNFSGKINGKSNLLTWITTAEQNNTGFEVQRSADVYNFNKIGFVNSKAVASNSNHKISYDFSDFTFTSATNYYRLKQIDKNGNFSFSNIVVLKNDKLMHEAFSLYPNPVTDVLNLAIAPKRSDKITFSIIDVAGRTLQTTVTHTSNSTMIIHLDVSTLPEGIYFLKILSANGKENMLRKFVRE